MTGTTIAASDKLADGVGIVAATLAKHWIGGEPKHAIVHHEARRVEFAAGVAVTIAMRTTHDLFAGEHSWNGSRQFRNPKEAQAHVGALARGESDPEFFRRHAAPLAHPAKFRALVGGGETTVVLRGKETKAHSSVACSGCGGDGQNACRQCGGHGDAVCTWGCGFSGHVRCDCCHGRGSNKDTAGHVHRCWKCNGRGEMVCPNCSGTGRRTCMGCSGAGAFACSPCETSGVVTHAYGVEVVGAVVPEILIGEGGELMDREVRKWIAEGMKEAVLVGSGTVLPEVSSIVGPEPDGSPQGGLQRMLMGLEGSFVRIDVEGLVDRMPFKGVGHYLTTIGCVFAPFLDPVVSKLAEACGRAAASGRPSEVAKAVGAGAGMADVLDDAGRRKHTPPQIAVAAAIGAMGSVSPEAIAEVVEASRSASLDYSEIAVRAAWRKVLPVATVVVFGAMLAGFCGAMQDAKMLPHAVLIFCAMAALVVGGVSKLAVRGIAGADLRREAGPAGRLPNVRLSRTAAIFMWLGWTAVLALPQIVDIAVARMAA